MAAVPSSRHEIAGRTRTRSPTRICTARGGLCRRHGVHALGRTSDAAGGARVGGTFGRMGQEPEVRPVSAAGDATSVARVAEMWHAHQRLGVTVLLRDDPMYPTRLSG